MTLDDDLRKALDSAAPSAPSPAGVRTGLTGRMRRARRTRRIRVATASTIAGLAALTGTALAVGQIATDDPAEIGPSHSLPAPDTSLPSVPGDDPSETASTSTPPTASTTDIPATSTTTSNPTTTQMPPVSQPSTSAEPGSAPVLSGPHTTGCGAVTFSHTNDSVSIDSRTVNLGYLFTTEGEGTSELHAKWDRGPGDECRVEAHLEDGVLEVQLDVGS